MGPSLISLAWDIPMLQVCFHSFDDDSFIFQFSKVLLWIFQRWFVDSIISNKIRNFLGISHDHSTATIFQDYCTKLTVVSTDCSLTINCPPQSSKTKATLKSLNRQSKFQS